ncbi:hypothetical protein HUA76_10280 [Myxococcus sp. CA056]|uniref:hypothetical protein n=1 Tax=Myxococcus sp. CA056 TaxID=2741740 RepID=UPI00157AF73F|nr:hypothetical protein [Myxococcus sp. CA056]NTX11175.1 hypothetical protein [Myxococcus sp. CA056]
MSHKPSESLRRDIERWLKEFLLNPTEPADQRELARELGGLPLYADMGGLVVLRPDGTVLTYDWEDSKSEATDDVWKVVALTTSREKYPRLRELLPERTVSALDCAACTGTGSILRTATCWKCLGLGWHEPEAVGVAG